jgi:hypothetical protein
MENERNYEPRTTAGKHPGSSQRNTDTMNSSRRRTFDPRRPEPKTIRRTELDDCQSKRLANQQPSFRCFGRDSSQNVNVGLKQKRSLII